ncbi:transmembrane protein 135 [Ixodes scapularis]|uniref:transmembrane protein 135 n=1 Tax=Ixodes scapularis TaxID=6945 RepID=UPI001161BB00|nr:transmembrane protein 135 [Ixodes scapularis]
MALLSKYAQLLEYHLPYNCYEIGHTWTPHCSEASVYVGLNAFKESMKMYLPLYAASLVYSNRYDKKAVRKTLQGALISSFFLSFNAFAFIAVFCSLRKLVGRFNFLNASYLPGFLASLMAILLERKSRRQALAIYVCNVASETIFRMKVSRNEVQPVKHGEVILFSVTTALFMYLIRRSGYLNDPVSKAFQFIVGKEEFVKGSSSPSPLGSPTPPSSVDASDNAGPATQELQAAWAYASQVLDDQSSWTQKQLAALGLNSRHWSCGHKRGCLAHVAHGFVRPFLVGCGVRILFRLVAMRKRILSDPSFLYRALYRADNLWLGVFLGSFGGIYRLVSCLLRWTGDGASDWHALPAGLLAGLAMFWYPSPSMALYLTWKLVENLYMAGMDKGILPCIPGSPVLLYSLSCAVLFYAAVFEPHNLRPTYWAFLNRLSSRRFSLLNRHVYDMFGVHSSKLFDDFWPKLDLKYTTRKFQESVLVWVPF